MEKKEAKRKYNSFWPLFSSGHNFKSFLFPIFYKSFNVPTNLRGFTLIELILVIGILSVLSIGGLTILNPVAQFQKANDVRRKSDLAQIQRALEVYYDDSGRYPPHFAETDYRIRGLDGFAVSWGSSWQPYMDVLPKDPAGSKTYVYFAGSDGQSYFLYASLDKGTDPGTCNRGNACTSLISNGILDTACGGTCNFGLSSPNVSP